MVAIATLYVDWVINLL